MDYLSLTEEEAFTTCNNLAIAKLSFAGVVLGANKEFLRIFEPINIMGLNWFDLISQEDQLIWETSVNNSVKRDSVVCDVRVCLERFTKWIRHRLIYLKDQKEFLMVISDVTQAKHLTEALEFSDFKFRKVFEEAPTIICFLRGPEFEFTIANKQAERLLGGRNVIGKKLKDILAKLPSNAHEILINCFKTGIRHTARDFYVPADWDGTGKIIDRYFTFSVEPMFASNGSVEGIWILSIDTSESKNMEAKLYVSEKLASLGTLAAGIGHEINNPLAYAKLNLELIQKSLREGAPTEELCQRISKAQEGLDKVQSIVKDLKVFSRSDDVPESSAVNLNLILDGALEMATNEIRHRALIAKSYKATPLVQGHHVKLGQVFLNLIVNAAQAIPEGRANENLIKLSTFEDKDGWVVAQITDTGSGISSENIKKIFDPFYTTKPVGMGTGLGLSICHGILTSLGGDIQVESRLGEGSTFTIKLPKAKDPKVELQAAVEMAFSPRPVARAKILVIDDEEHLIEAICQFLGEDFDVVATKSGVSAIDLLKPENKFDLILCDIMLPDGTGMDIYEVTKQKTPGLEKKIIFMSGGTFTPRATKFLENIENLRLNKPFKSGELINIIKSSLS
jgi:signal transduction histidine kinase